MPCNSKYRSCVTDMVPVGELEHGGECDLGVHITDSEGGELAKIFKIVRRAGRRQETTDMRPKVIIRASKVILEVGAYDELPSEVVNLPDESEYRCCLADMVPAGELEHGGVCDKGVNTDPIRREVDLKKMFKTEIQAGRR